ncbi:MAG TPA: LysM peptidoglycan-binding domain-containing protein [Burkholderiaceae bacterium]|nr:LysM peptidoglycan-binding domain-containing protein [Burkholderiaceae bacterium]
MIRRHATALSASLLALACTTEALAQNYPITPQQRSTAQQVAQAGVPLEDLAPNAPDSHTVKRGDTLWDISKLFLKSPWRWPQLWGMNLDQIRNPHLIYPGQVLVLDKSGGRARLRLAGDDRASGTDKLSPRVRGEALGDDAIASIPLNLIGPFLSDGVVLNANELDRAPRVVAAPEGRVMMGRGDKAYVRGDLGTVTDWRLFRQATPLRDPTTNEILGYEARFVANAAFVREGGSAPGPDGKGTVPVPSTFEITTIKEEVGVGDRLAPTPARDFSNFVPRAPGAAVGGQVIRVYGDSLIAGQNQVVAINRGSRDGMERGHVLAVWRDGERAFDRTSPGKPVDIKLPDERHGLMLVFRTFERVSYALVLQVQRPVQTGDRFTQP